MQVKIKEFKINMDVKASGIEFEVRTPDGKSQHGDCILTMSGLTWCQGRKPRSSGVKMSWEDFMEIAKSKNALKAAVKAAKSAS